MSNEHSTFPEILVSHDAITYKDHLPLHNKNQHQFHQSLTGHDSNLCSSSDKYSNQASSANELLGLIVDDDNSADEAIKILQNFLTKRGGPY